MQDQFHCPAPAESSASRQVAGWSTDLEHLGSSNSLVDNAAHARMVVEDGPLNMDTDMVDKENA